MKKEKIFIFICLVLLSACSPSSLDGIVIEKAADGYKLSIDGRETYIKGVGAQHVRNAGNRHDQRLHTLLR